MLLLAALAALAIAGCGQDESTAVAVEGAADTGPLLPTTATTMSPGLGADVGGAVESTTTTTTTFTTTTIPPTTTSPPRFEPVGEQVAAPAVEAICDRVAVLSITVASMGPDYSADEAATLGASLESLTMDGIDAATDPLVLGDGFSANRLADCLETAARSVTRAVDVEL